jgi:hypothetical protein
VTTPKSYIEGDDCVPKLRKPKIPKAQKIQGNYKLIPENTLLSKEFQNRI